VLQALGRAGLPTSMASLQALVSENDKQRFEFSADGNRIRARQGHSIAVDAGWRAASPPPILYHGTSGKFLGSIWAKGLLRGSRHHVHLPTTASIARAVGARRGDPVVLCVDAARMAADGFTFWVTSNRVWLADHVPPAYLTYNDC
jgi:putative RNA 2'-phosphotransferase